MGQVRAALPWADSRKVKEEIDLQILTLLGPKREEDLVKPAKAKAEKKEKPEKPTVNATQPSKCEVVLCYNHLLSKAVEVAMSCLVKSLIQNMVMWWPFLFCANMYGYICINELGLGSQVEYLYLFMVFFAYTNINRQNRY